MHLELQVHPTETLATEFATVSFELPGKENAHVLDVDFGSALERCRTYGTTGLDLLLVASSIYAVDKAVSRSKHATDRWTRELSVSIPVHDDAAWNAVADAFSNCVSFLTGDVWQVRFTNTTIPLFQIRANRRRKPLAFLPATAVSLFSGGLDSFIGAIDYLCQDDGHKLLLVSHYERHVKGPMSDQDALFEALKARFPGRADHLQMRVGLHDAGEEISFRSRSLLFLALGLLAAEHFGPTVPVHIPENGPIALNMPLTPTRRGSCSTRTAHPHFLQQLQSILPQVGLNQTISNPYQFRTKGEMVAECWDLGFLTQHAIHTVSCAKAGRKIKWAKGVRECGTCVPCLFRRASLHAKGLDVERYHKDVCGPNVTQADLTADTLALLALLKRDPSTELIRRSLAANGPVPFQELNQYADVVARMIVEVRSWLLAKGAPAIKTLATV